MSTRVSTILIADDDRLIRDVIVEVLQESGHELLNSATAAETWRVASQHKPDLILLDLKFPDAHDLSLLRRLRQELPETEVIIISSQGDKVSQVVEAIKLGAYDFVGKPFEPEELCNRVEKCLDFAALRRSQSCLLKELKTHVGIDALIGNSASMARIRELLHRLAIVDGCVLVCGESGTGKELAARALHYLGPRKTQPFMTVNCAAIPEALVESVLFGHKKGSFTGAHESIKGRFEAAGDGTIFLDEIGDMPLPQQASLLRVLEYRRYTPLGETSERICRARFVLASNRDLREAVNAGAFRQDLYFRINVANMVMPPLRSRVEDIAETAAYYCDRFCAEMGRRPMLITHEAMKLMSNYDWPGNVRELKNLIESVIMLADPATASISPADLPVDIVAATPDESVNGVLSANDTREKRELLTALKQTKGNQREAARLLGWHRNTVRNKLRRFGIALPENG